MKPPQPKKILANDIVDLGVHFYLPDKPQASLHFYRGGDAHSGTNYEHIDRGLCDDFQVAVNMPDIRGHGTSGGNEPSAIVSQHHD